MLDTLVASKYMLCEFFQNEWNMKNPICDKKGVFGLIM